MEVNGGKTAELTEAYASAEHDSMIPQLDARVLCLSHVLRSDIRLIGVTLGRKS